MDKTFVREAHAKYEDEQVYEEARCTGQQHGIERERSLQGDPFALYRLVYAKRDAQAEHHIDQRSKHQIERERNLEVLQIG